MKPEAVTAVVEGLREAGINFIASLPSSALAPAIHTIMSDADFIHVPVANEEDAIGICAGAWLAGKKPVFMAQNAGLILATHALLGTLHALGGIPILLVLAHRGDFGDTHFYTFGYGIQTPQILESFQIPYTIVHESNKLTIELVRGQKTAEAYGKPAAILLSGEEIYGN